MPHRWRELHPCVIIRIAMLTGGRCADPRNLADGAIGSDAIKATAPPAETRYAPTISAPIGYCRRVRSRCAVAPQMPCADEKSPARGVCGLTRGETRASVGGKPAR